MTCTRAGTWWRARWGGDLELARLDGGGGAPRRAERELERQRAGSRRRDGPVLRKQRVRALEDNREEKWWTGLDGGRGGE